MLTVCSVRRATTLIDVAWVTDGPRGTLTNAYSERVFRAAWHALERSKSAVGQQLDGAGPRVGESTMRLQFEFLTSRTV